MQHPLGMLDRDQRTTKSIPATGDRSGSYCWSCAYQNFNSNECKSDTVLTKNKKSKSKLQFQSAYCAIDSKIRLSHFQASPKYAVSATSARFGPYRSKKLNHCPIVLVYICVILLQKALAYPSIGMDTESQACKCSKMCIEQFENSYNVAKRSLSLLENTIENYINERENKSLQSYHQIWRKLPRNFNYSRNYNDYHYMYKPSVEQHQHLNAPELTIYEITEEIRKLRTITCDLGQVFRYIHQQYKNNDESQPTPNDAKMRNFFARNIDQLNHFERTVNETWKELPDTHKTADDDELYITDLKDKSRDRNLVQDWLALREVLAVLTYGMRSFEILIMKCNSPK